MEINTTAIDIEDGLGPKVIHIYNNGPQENQDDLLSVFTIKKKSNGKGQYKMYAIMKQKSKHLENLNP